MNGFDAHLFPKKKDYPLGSPSFLEQDTGVEPAFTAWEAVVLPIYESCMVVIIADREGKFNCFLSQPKVGTELHKNRNIKFEQIVMYYFRLRTKHFVRIKYFQSKE